MMKLMKNKKGMVPIVMFLVFIVAMIVFMFGTGAITSFIIRRTFNNIPGWFWVALIGFVILILLKRKQK